VTVHGRFGAKELALTICFTALYVVFGFLNISPIIGLPGRAVTAAAIVAPIIGVILGPYVGALSAFLGGVIGFFVGFFSPPSLVSGVAAASCAGLTYAGKRMFSVLLYLSLLVVFAFYPTVGPAWLYPLSIWFQLTILVVLVSPLQSRATKGLSSNSNSKLLYTFFVTSLTSTMAGQVAGSLAFEATSWPILIPNVNVWVGIWQSAMFLYPIERIIIAVAATLIAAPLVRVLKSANFISVGASRDAKTEPRPSVPS
jgi:hypothetical protein